MQGLKSRSKVKGLKDTLVIIFKMTTNTLPLDFILFINNYFIEPKLTKALKAKRIAIYGTIKPNRTDLSELLMKMKKIFFKNIPYEVLAAVIQNDILFMAWQDNNLVLALITTYSIREINNTVSKKRKRPSKINTNARIILPTFKENKQTIAKKEFKVSKLFYYYNKYIKKINRFNALITTYTSQRAYNRN